MASCPPEPCVYPGNCPAVLCCAVLCALPSSGVLSCWLSVLCHVLQLARNKQLDQFFVRNLNKDPDGWELADQTFDAVVCCVR